MSTKGIQLSLFPANDNDPPGTKPKRNDIRNGDAAEAYVLAKLLRAGLDAHPARRDAPYDLVVDLGNGRYCRIEVKGQERAQRGKYYFEFKRGNPRTGNGSYAYGDTDHDMVALVALSLESVIFVPGVQKAPIRLSTADFLRSGGEAQSMARAFAVFNRAA
jgi:hypothetical protein